MRILIRNVNIILPDRIMREGWLVTQDELIDDFGTGTLPKGEFSEEVDGKGMFLSPGFVDTHVHGGRRHDFSVFHT